MLSGTWWMRQEAQGGEYVQTRGRTAMANKAWTGSQCAQARRRGRSERCDSRRSIKQADLQLLSLEVTLRANLNIPNDCHVHEHDSTSLAENLSILARPAETLLTAGGVLSVVDFWSVRMSIDTYSELHLICGSQRISGPFEKVQRHVRLLI
eukprot:3673475-Pleurochrysis_carterae.AAC.2